LALRGSEYCPFAVREFAIDDFRTYYSVAASNIEL
jgi:hypothetical protein